MSNKKRNKKTNIRKAANYVGILSLTAAAGVGLAYGIKYASSDHRYNNYTGSLVKALNNIERDPATDRFILGDIVNNVYLDDGRGNHSAIDLTPIFKAQKANDPELVKAEIDNVDKQYTDKVKATGVNYNLVVETDILRFENNYFDIFGTKDTLDFLDFLLNNVSWGVDVLSLYDFKIVRGVPKDGGVITLGGNTATRDKSAISFWPDAFFGVLPVLDLGGESVLTTTNNINFQGIMSIANNKNILNDFMTHEVDGKTALPMEIIAKWDEFAKFTSVWGNGPDVDNHPDAIQLTPDVQQDLQPIFTAQVWEDWVKVFGDAELNKMSQERLFSGTDSDRANFQVPGNFPSLISFNNYVKGKHDLPIVDHIIADDGHTEITVYPWDYMRRVLIGLYFPSFTASEISSRPDYAANPDNYNLYKVATRDALRRKQMANQIYVSDYPYACFKPVIFSPSYETENLGTHMNNPFIWENFVGFERVVSKSAASRIAQAMFVAAGINPYKTISTAELDANGEPMVTLLYEKYLDILPTFERIREEEGWSPIDFEGDKVYEDQFIPLLYLWTEMKDENGNRLTSFADTTYATDGSLTPSEVQHLDDLTRQSLGKHDIGIEWLKYVTSHEYGHHRTLRGAKDLSDTTDRAGAQSTADISTPGQVYAGASWNTNYENVWSKNFINNYLMARTGVGGNIFVDDETGRQINMLLADFTVQYNAWSSKEAPYFAILGEDRKIGGAVTPIIGRDANGNPIINEQAAVDFADFAQSWRGFKTLQETVESVIEAAKSEGVQIPSSDGELPSNIALIAALMNSADRNSFTLGSALPTPMAGFAGDGVSTNGRTGSENGEFQTLNPRDTGLSEDQVDLSRWIRGWHDYTGESLRIATDTGVFTLEAYRQMVRDDQRNIVVGPDGRPVTAPLTLPRSFIRSFITDTFDFQAFMDTFVEFGDDGRIANVDSALAQQISGGQKTVSGEFDNFFKDRLLNALFGGSAYTPLIVAPDESETSWPEARKLIFAEARSARNWYVELAFDPSTGQYYRSLAEVPQHGGGNGPSQSFTPTDDQYNFLLDIDDALNNDLISVDTDYDDFETLITSWGLNWFDLLDGDFNQQVTPGVVIPDYANMPAWFTRFWSAAGWTATEFDSFKLTLTSLVIPEKTPIEKVLDAWNALGRRRPDEADMFNFWLSSQTDSVSVIDDLIDGNIFTIVNPLPSLEDFKLAVDPMVGMSVYDAWINTLGLTDQDWIDFSTELTNKFTSASGPSLDPYMTQVLVSSGLININGDNFSFASLMQALAASYENQVDENGVRKNWVIVGTDQATGQFFTSEFVLDQNGNPTTERVTANTPGSVADTFNWKMQRMSHIKVTDETDPNELADAIEEVRLFLLGLICDELNKEVDRNVDGSQGRFIYADAPIRQGAIGEEDLREILGQIFGALTFSPEQNDGIGASISTTIFQSYFQNFGRFFGIQSTDPSIIPGVTSGYYPSAVTLISFLFANVPVLNWTYTTYLAQGAFPYYGQITVDYQTGLAEMLTRDLNQLTYSPSRNPLQQTDGKNYNELNNMVVYSLYPIYTHVFSEDGAVMPIPGTGVYNKDTGEFIPKTMNSGFFEDLALRRETDSSLYNLNIIVPLLDENGLAINLRDENGDLVLDENGHPIPISGHPINHLGKALVNFFRESFGISEFRDVSSFYVDEETGFGTIGGYFSQTDSEKYKFLAFEDVNTHQTTYIPIRTGYSNDFFNTQLGVRESRVSMLDHYYDANGQLVHVTDPNKIQVGWTTDEFLMKGFANSVFQPGHEYNVFFAAENRDGAATRTVNLGYDYRTTFISNPNTPRETDDIYAVRQDDWRTEYVANSFDTFTGTIFMNQEGFNRETRLRITAR